MSFPTVGRRMESIYDDLGDNRASANLVRYGFHG